MYQATLKRKAKTRRKKKNSFNKVLVLILMIFTATYGAKVSMKIIQDETLLSLSPKTSFLMPQITPIIKYKVAANLDINSSNAILISFNEGDNNSEVIYEKRASERIYPASLTKIMTAIIAIENIRDLNENIILNEKMYPNIYESNASVAGYSQNERVQAIDLLYGLMLPSGAECAIGLAEYVAGSEKAFVNQMNDKAQELGLNETHFINATGLHDEKHYSTASDIAVLLEYALGNDNFYKIFTTESHSSKATNIHPDGISYYSTMFSKMESTEFDGGKILGGKTGYTSEAGQCLASLAEKDGEKFILITCGATGYNRTQKFHIDDAFSVYAAIIKNELP